MDQNNQRFVRTGSCSATRDYAGEIVKLEAIAESQELMRETAELLG